MIIYTHDSNTHTLGTKKERYGEFMREFLIELQSVYDQIANNQVDRLEAGLSAEQVISYYKNIREKLSSLRLASEDILVNHLFPMLEDISAISDEDEEALYITAQKISAYETRVDPALALKIYRGLLEWARVKQDDAKILKYLYWCGITLNFFSEDEREQILEYFEEGASYAEKYHTFDEPETRKYIHRCLGNTSMVYYFMDEPEKAMEVDEYAFCFWNRLMFFGKDPDFPWLNYFLTCLNHRYSFLSQNVHTDPDSETGDVLKKLLETAIMINKLYLKNCDSFQVFGGTRYDYVLWESQFLNGLISFDMLCENIEKRKAEFAPDDYSADAMYVKHDLNIYMIFYAKTMQRLRGVKDEFVASISKETIEYFSKLPVSVDPRGVSEQLLNSALHLSSALKPDEQLDFVKEMTTFRHIPTYAHSIMVSKIAQRLTEYLISKSPGSFVGCLGICGAEEVRGKAEELCRYAEKSGLCHDIGKISFILNPYMNARILTDEEYEFIRRHTSYGKSMLMRDDNVPYYDAYVDVIFGHHKFFNNAGGYPADFDIESSEYRIMIDIISVADSIDAATDDTIKTYAQPKSLDEVCAEIIADAGNRYSPVVANALEDGILRESLAAILDYERKKAYYAAYCHAWS